MRLRLLLPCILLSSTISYALNQEAVKTISDFEEWYKSANIHFEESKVTVGKSNFEHLRPGLIAKKDIEEEEVFLRIPEELIITPLSLTFTAVSPCVEPFQDRWGDPNSIYNAANYDVLSLWILYEKFINTDSKWKYWLDILPEIDDMDNILFWSSTELSELKGSPLFKRATERRRIALEKYNWANENLFKTFTNIWTRIPTLEEWKWAISIVRSINIHLWIDGKSIPTLLPMVDFMHNEILPYDSPLDVLDMINWNSDTREVELTSIKYIKAGEEINAYFVEKCNSELVDFHGYIPPENPNDCVHLDLEVPNSDPLVQEKNLLYTTVNFESAKLKILKNGVTSDLIQAVRILTLTEHDLTSDMLIKGVPEESLGIHSEYLIAEYIINQCRKAFLSYPTTIQEDEELLRNTEELSYRERMAIELRLGEKKIIQTIGSYYYNVASKYADILQQMKVDTEEEQQEQTGGNKEEL